MNLQLENKTALITGSTKGIGFAIARLLAAEGANVIVNGRGEDSTRAAAQKIGGRARGIAADISTAEGCGKLASNAKQTPGEFEKEFFRSARPTSLLGRFATVEEVANMVAYVCSPLASATNGAALRVDAGVVRGTV